MSSTQRAKKKKDDIFSKKVPENPKYKHIKPTVDTGSSITKYMARLEEIKKDYKYRNDEIFKRIKANTFAQLVLQVADVISMEQERDSLSTAAESVLSDGRVSPTFEERETEAPDENVPPLNLPKDDTHRLKTSSMGADTTRSTLQDLIRGVGEVDVKGQEQQLDEQSADLASSRSSQAHVAMPDVETMPYLLLDVRNPDEFEKCHIIGALNYPIAMLSRTVNYFTKEILTFKNKTGKIIILYDEDERYAASVTSTCVERGVDNIFMLSGGMKVLNKRFPGGFLSGTLPTSCFPSPPPTRRAYKKPATSFLTPDGQHWAFFTSHHLQKIQDCLNEELLKQENSSRMSSRVSSRSSIASSKSGLSTSSASSSSSKKPAWK